MRGNGSTYAACGICVFVVALCAPAQAQLPSEATLPGREPLRVELPGEDVLPVGMAESRRPSMRSDNLPAERELPAAPPAAQVPRSEARPWLRLDMAGHTGTVRTLAFTPDSKRLCSAGEDKAVHVWLRADDDLKSRREWIHERTVRWQIQRGPRGHIFSLATSLNLLAMAGYGAMGGNGEILLVDPATGALRRHLVDEHTGHRQVIKALAFVSANPSQSLASIDAQGHAILWRPDEQSGIWSSTVIDEPDSVTYGASTAKRLEPFRRFAPLAVVGESHIAIPRFSNQWNRDGIPLWNISLYRLDNTSREPLSADTPHYSMVTALAASRDGQRLASADAYGQLLLWDLPKRSLAKRIQQPAAVVSLCFDPSGNRLLVGTAQSPRLRNRAVIQLWDVRSLGQPVKQFESDLSDHVYACAISPDGQRFAYSQDNAILLRPLQNPNRKPTVLRPRIAPPRNVAFARNPPLYRIAFGTKSQPDGSVPLENTFDPHALQLGKSGAPRPEDWVRPSWWRGDWRVRTDPADSRGGVWLYRGGQRKAQLPLIPDVHGTPTTWCWIPDRRGVPLAIAVGTNVRNNIYVFRLAEEGPCPLLRQFRGHSAPVTSVGVSMDLRYLVSGSEDATIGIWKLEGFDTKNSDQNRWGADWELQDGQLVAASVDEEGPLYFRGIRGGDVVTRVAWVDENSQQRQETATPAEMLGALRQIEFDKLVLFEYSRNRAAQPGFQVFPAWQQVVSLFVADDREWAYWTPAGFYDASFNGHKLFGWQINRGLDVLPDFFLAAQFRKTLERPEVMGRLLDAGGLEAAFRAARADPPAESHQMIANQYWLKPEVSIMSPAEGQELAGDEALVTALITVRNGQQLVTPKAFANGVVAAEPRQVDDRDVPGGHTYVYEWKARLPSDPRVLLQVVAATEDEVTEVASITVKRNRLPDRTPRRLYVVSAGINEYRDPQIQRLDFASSNARQVADTLRRQSALLYRCESTALLDDLATKPLWNAISEEYVEQLNRHVSPDDVLLMYLSGHGVRDEATQDYYYVTADAKFADVKSERYGDCISVADLHRFSQLPCRKIVILDTCHSGAIQQPLRQRDLKAALRLLQEDVVLTLTASEGDQEAVEDKQKRLGRFTYRLIEALGGAADDAGQGGNHDGVVTFTEAAAYVQRLVADDSAAGDVRQHPTVGPIDLVDFVQVPLTSR